MRARKVLLSGLSAVILVTGALTLEGAGCETYSNSGIVSAGGSYWCGGSGGGCTECVENKTGGYCVTNGSSCRP